MKTKTGKEILELYNSQDFDMIMFSTLEEMIDIEIAKIKNQLDQQDPNVIEVPLFQIEFEENWISFKLPDEQMEKAFHTGSAIIDLTGVR